MELPKLFLAAKLYGPEDWVWSHPSEPNSSVLLCPGQHSHTGPVLVWQNLLAGLCAILLRIYSLVGNINVSFSQIYLVDTLVLSIGQLPYILPI